MLVQTQVYIRRESDGRWHIYNATTEQYLIDAATEDEAKAIAWGEGWRVVLPGRRIAA